MSTTQITATITFEIPFCDVMDLPGFMCSHCNGADARAAVPKPRPVRVAYTPTGTKKSPNKAHPGASHDLLKAALGHRYAFDKRSSGRAYIDGAPVRIRSSISLDPEVNPNVLLHGSKDGQLLCGALSDEALYVLVAQDTGEVRTYVTAEVEAAIPTSHDYLLGQSRNRQSGWYALEYNEFPAPLSVEHYPLPAKAA